MSQPLEANPKQVKNMSIISSTLAARSPPRVWMQKVRLIGLTVLPGVIAALEALRDRSLRMGIISNRGNVPPETVTQELDAAGLLACFDLGTGIGARASVGES